MTESDLKTAITQDGVNLRHLDMHTAIKSLLSKENLPAGPIPWTSLFIRAVAQMASAAEISSRYGGLPVAEVNAAHFLQLEQPAETNRIIRRFLEGLN